MTAYKEIEGFPGYRVGDDGSIWSCWRTCRVGSRMTNRWKRLKPIIRKGRTTGRSYHHVNLVRSGSYKSRRIHRIVMEAFIGPCPEGMECRHLDGDPANNRLCNLTWGTPEENREDNRRLGTIKKGEAHGMSKLTELQVREIRTRYATGGVLQRDLAVAFGVNVPTISHVVNRKTWTHID